MKRWLSKPLRLSKTSIRMSKVLIHLIAFGAVSYEFYLGISDLLGADPVKALIHFTGLGSVILLLLSLTISPLAKRLPSGDLLKFRRLIGLYAFFYALLHLATFIAFEIQFDWSLVAEEIIDRPYITIGFVSLLGLLVLSVTSVNSLKRRMGASWARLHQNVYWMTALALLHFSWSKKVVLEEPLFYWLAFGLLMYLRQDLWQHIVRKKRKKTLA